MKKKMVSMLLVSALTIGTIAGCSTGIVADDAAPKKLAIVDKALNEWPQKECNGFITYAESQGYEAANMSVEEISVGAQVQAIDATITQGYDGIAINATGDTGFDEVIKKAKNENIAIVSLDAALSKENRTVHINQTTNADAGEYMLRLGVLAALGVEYPGDDMVSTLEAALAEYDGPEIQLGCLSAGVDSPVQNAWLVYMNAELQKDMYKGKVNPEMDIKYGNDDVTESGNQALAYLAEDKVDVIICISGAALPAANAVFEGSGSDIKITGCCLPSQAQEYMPKEGDDYFSTTCPYVLLWDIRYLGAVSAAALIAEVDGDFDGSVGSTLDVAAWDTYEATTYTVTETEDGGSEIVLGAPLVFDMNNLQEWVDKL